MRVRVPLDERSYDVVIAPGARHDLASLLDVRAPQARVVAVVAPTRLRSLKWFDFSSGRDEVAVDVPDSEGAKTLANVEALCVAFSNAGLSRRDVIVAVGGGATTDLVGFASSVYLRGVSVVHVATSLVAQVDAAIGGKTGVNLSSGKNLVGAFHQPLGVLCDLDVLSTLSERERIGGHGEIAKCWLLRNGSRSMLEHASLEELIVESVRLKADIVGSDEREGAQRALLNYGHTLAHALEASALAGGEVDIRHGEAVGIGLAFAVRLARRLGRVGDEAVRTHDEVLDFFSLPRHLDHHWSIDELVMAMGRDKKAHHDLTFVLAGPDGYETVAGVPEWVVREVLSAFQGEL